MFDEYGNRIPTRPTRTRAEREETALAVLLSIGLLAVLILANVATK